MYSAVTRDICVNVTPYFIEDQSSPEDAQYVWAYQVSIENNGVQTVQLRSRYWKITDASGHVQEVQGAGVVGEQPTLKPGESFEYTSGAPLATPSGIMSGRYMMEGDGGESFEIEIPAFSLDSPYEIVSLN